MASTYRSTARERGQRVAPELRPAGVAGDYTEATVGELISTYNSAAPPTPEHITTFRNGKGAVGRGVPRIRGAPAQPAVSSGGRRGDANSAAVCLQPTCFEDKVHRLLREQQEKRYRSNQRCPLGRAPLTAAAPEAPPHGFGTAIKHGDSAEATLRGWREVDVLHPAGEQLNRAYDWPRTGIDPTSHRFGCPTTSSESAAACLRSDADDPPLLPQIVREYKSTVRGALGKPRPHGFDDPADWGDVHAGRGRRRAEAEPSVKDLTSSWAVGVGTAAAAAEDGTEDKTDPRESAGVPAGGGVQRSQCDAGVTLGRGGRTVVALRELDDEATAGQLVNPCHYVSLGVRSAYFAGGRELEDIRALCHRCHFDLPDEQIDALFHEISRDGRCGIEQFKNAAVAKGLM